MVVVIVVVVIVLVVVVVVVFVVVVVRIAIDCLDSYRSHFILLFNSAKKINIRTRTVYENAITSICVSARWTKNLQFMCLFALPAANFPSVFDTA